MEMEINSRADFKLWVRMSICRQGLTQEQLAEQMKIKQPRISEALNGKQSGEKYIVPLIEELGGNVEDFKAIL